MNENLRHNCCKKNDFEWKSIDPLGNSADRLICKNCKREFIDTIFIETVKRMINTWHAPITAMPLMLREIDKLAGVKDGNG